MLIKKGIPVSPGIAIAKAIVLDTEDQPISRRIVPQAAIPNELQRLQTALEQAAADIKQQRAAAEARVGPELARIFSAHQAMLADPQLINQISSLVEQDRVTAEFAVQSVMREWAGRFQKLESRIFRDRANDILDLERRVLQHLIGRAHADLANLKSDIVVVARDLTPSQTASLNRTHAKALLTDAGGRTSHTAILAHALGIPAIVGLEDLSSQVTTGDQIIVDANNGIVIVNPDASQLLEYRQYAAHMARVEISLDEQVRLPAITLDGVEITVWANIEFPYEVPLALQKGATGIGLFRTEFLFLACEEAPTEEQQLDAYRRAIAALGDKPLTIRTLDLGADKLARCLQPGREPPREDNPFLGVRSIRLCLENPPLFKTQLRAILRASTEGNVRVMFPLVSHIMELRQAKMLLNDVMEDLEEEGLPFNRDIPTGVMIEVPSAALQAKTFAREVAFFSIGTNDLIQYTLAVDRGNERLASLYSAAHPAVCHLIKDVIRAAKRAKIDVGLCGEMAGDPIFVPLLLGMGLRIFSAAPAAIPEIKRIVRSVSIPQCQRIARKALSFESDRETLNYLHDQIRRIAPDLFPRRSMEP